MPHGVSLKVRYRIDKSVGIWKPKRVRRMVEASIIGSEAWNREVQEKLDQLRTHKGNYSEKYEMRNRPRVVGGVADQIDYLLCPAARPTEMILARPAPKGWKRPPITRSRRRELAFSIAGQLSGFDWVLYDPTPLIVPGKLDPRLDWLLREIYTVSKGTCYRNFLVAIAKDAGVWPSPKWWRVTRRLLGDNRSFAKNASHK